MIASRINRTRIANVALAVLALSLPAAGQDDSDAHEAITSITLPDPPQPAAKPAAPAPQPVVLAKPGAALPPDIQVSALGSAEGQPVGLIDGAGDIWQGSAKADVEVLIAHALATNDPPLRDIARRLVLAKAEAPAGHAKRPLLATRIDILLQAGLIDEAAAMAAMAKLPKDAGFARIQANALLYAGRGEEACGTQTAEFRQSSGEKFWIELRAACAALAGDSAMSELTMAVLKAQGGDPIFESLLIAATTGAMDKPFVSIPDATALHIFLLRRAGLPVTDMIAAAGGTPENLFAARDTRNAADVRLKAAERIVETGVLGPAELRVLLDAQIFTDSAIDGVDKMPFLAGQARLRHAVLTEPQPSRKAFLLATAMNLAARKGKLALAAAIDADLIAALPPTKIPDAALFARTLALAGDAKAFGWPVESAPLRAGLLLLSGNPADDARLKKLLDGFAEDLAAPLDPAKPDPLRDAKAKVLLTADALGRLPPDLVKTVEPWRKVPWGGKRPSELTMDRIRNDALVPGKRGETLLRILDAVRTIGWRDLSPDAAAECVRLMRAFGFEDAAKAMARESLLLYVPPPPPAPVPAL